MAKPRIFVSSTYYDLKHIRASLSLFIDSLGYESILFEKGQIAFVSDDPLDISCYREAASADIFVLIIGGRYGSETSEVPIKSKSQYTDYNSITHKEYETASHNHIPTYILIEKGVYAEYQTYKNNRENNDIKYAHVDNVSIFKLIDEIHNKPNNNPIFSFEKYNEIEEWLREQWAGLFKDFLAKRGNIKKFESLQKQVQNLEDLNITFKKYLETLLEDSDKKYKDDVIIEENEKLRILKFKQAFEHNMLFNFLLKEMKISDENLKLAYQAIKNSNNINEAFEKIYQLDLPFKDELTEGLFNAIEVRNETFKENVNKFLNEAGMKNLAYKEAQT